MPESDSVGREVLKAVDHQSQSRAPSLIASPGHADEEWGRATHDLVGKIVEDVRLPLIDAPLALLADHPLQLGVAGAGLAADPA